VATLLAYDDTHGAPMANMPHTGFQRLDAGAMTVIIGHRPAAAAERQPGRACRLPLVRTVVRAEPDRDQLRHALDRPRQLARFARGTAAHSTLTYHDTSSCQFVELSAMKRLLQGAPIVSGPANVESYREASPTAMLLTTSHDGYLARASAWCIAGC
jgi:uncharacterized heparinase superfamily protein